MRIGTQLLIVALLFPIILGAIASNEQRRREMFQAMRADHLRRIASDHARLAARRAARERVRHERPDAMMRPGAAAGPYR
jgi:hypothetical protein